MPPLRERGGVRARAGHRPGDHRADPDDARRRRSPRTTSSGSAAAARQPLGQQRAAQHLPHRGRRWVAVSTSAQSIAERVMRLVGRPELIDEPWFATGAAGRARRRAGRRGRRLDRRAAAATRWSPRSRRPRRRSRRSTTSATSWATRSTPRSARCTSVDDEELGAVRMQNVLFRLSGRRRRSAGPAARTARTPTSVLAELGLDAPRSSPSCAAKGVRYDAGPVITALYVPGDRPDRFDKAVATGRRRGDPRPRGRGDAGEQGGRPGGGRRSG